MNNSELLLLNLKFSWKKVYAFLASVPPGDGGGGIFSFFVAVEKKSGNYRTGEERVLKGSWKLAKKQRQLVLQHTLPLFLFFFFYLRVNFASSRPYPLFCSWNSNAFRLKSFWKRLRDGRNAMNAVVLIPGHSVFCVLHHSTHTHLHADTIGRLSIWHVWKICLRWSWGDGVVSSILCEIHCLQHSQ